MSEAIAVKRPQFGVNTKEMPATLPLLEAGEYAAKIISSGINAKVPLTIQLETLFDEARKPYDGTDWILRAPFGFGLGFQLISEKAIHILGRDEPKYFPAKGITLVFHKYGTIANDQDISYTWMGSPVLKELLNVVGLGNEDYGSLVDEPWIDELDFLLDRLGFTSEEVGKLKAGMSDEQLLVAANAVNYYRAYFDVMAKDITNRLCKVVMTKTKIKDCPSKMENNIYSGDWKNPSCGVVAYTEGCENDK